MHARYNAIETKKDTITKYKYWQKRALVQSTKTDAEAAG